MDITVKYGSYNQRRYGRPWIGKITDWPIGKYPVMDFGVYVGDDNGGIVSIDAQPGDIVRHGQKDYRGNHTSKDWYVVNESGNLDSIDASVAQKLWAKNHQKVNA